MTYQHEKIFDSSELSSEPEGFACKDLAEMGLPDFPSTERGWGKLVEREQWPWREVRAQGGKAGVKRLYQPPAAVMALVRMRLLARSFEQFRSTIAVGDPLTTAKLMFLEEYNKHGPSTDYVDGVDAIGDEDLEAALRLSRKGAKGVSVASAPAPFRGQPATNHVEVMERTASVMVARCMQAAQQVLGPDHDRGQAISLSVDTWGSLCKMFPPDKAERLNNITDGDLELLATFVLNTRPALYP